MPQYVDGFVVPVPRKNVPAYRRFSQAAGRVWRDHGALEFRECIGDDHNVPMVPFPKLAKLKRGETVFFSWVLFRSRAHRDQVNAKVMKDPRILRMLKTPNPFDAKRMAYGGFKVLVDM